ncbi:MAG: hypothetical protein ACM34H_02745, partial [Deltaproteobacteria bacterium]
MRGNANADGKTRARSRSETARRLILVLAGFWCAFLTGSCSTVGAAGPKDRTLPEYLTGDEAQSARVYRRILPSVVTILTSQKAFADGQ